jgi:hypothetical protein
VNRLRSLAALTAVLALAPAASASAATSSFRIVPVPAKAGMYSLLADATPDRGNTAWAVGYQGMAPGPFEGPPGDPLVLHWVDGALTPTPVRDAEGTGERETDVAAAGPENTWMIGEGNDGQVLRRWNGTDWVRQTTGLTGPQGPYQPTGVAAHGDRAWLIGTDWVGSGEDARVAAWNGTRWRFLPAQGPEMAELWDVDATAADNVWTLGQGFTDSGFRSTIEQWNGSAWVDRLPLRTDLNLQKLAVVSPTDVWAYGEHIDSPGEVTMTLVHWDGTRWTDHLLPSGSEFGGLTVAPDGAVWVVGTGSTPDRATYLRFDGTSVQSFPGPRRADGVYIQIRALITLPRRAEPMAVGIAATLGSPQTAAAELRRPPS